MTMNRYFLDGFGTDEEYDALVRSKVFPLVRELEFKYGLKVLRSVPVRDNWGDSLLGYQLCNKYGIAIGKVWTNSEGGKERNQLEYCYRSPYYSKERGATREDKETFRSIKVASLMAAINRVGAIPPADEMTTKKVKLANDGIELMRRALGVSNKHSELQADDVHALLAHFFGENPNSLGLSIDVDKCKNLFDKYNEADRIRELKSREVERAFANPFFMIGIDEIGHFIVGKFKVKDNQYETVEPFKRYKSYEDVPEIVSFMTMAKVRYENSGGRLHYGFPLVDLYDADLDMTFFYTNAPTHYDCLWMTTPC